MLKRRINVENAYEVIRKGDSFNPLPVELYFWRQAPIAS